MALSRRSLLGVLTGAIAAPMIVPVRSLMAMPRAPVTLATGLHLDWTQCTPEQIISDVQRIWEAVTKASDEWDKLMFNGVMERQSLVDSWERGLIISGGIKCDRKITTTSPNVVIHSLD